MEATAFSPYQMKVIGLMEHVKSDEQMKKIGNLLSDYFAQKAVQEADNLWDDKVIDCSTIEKWKNEHFRYDACGLWTTFRYQYPVRVVGNMENFHETTLVGHEKGMKRA